MERLEREVERLRAALAAQDTTGTADLRAQLDAITREIERLKLGEQVATADTVRDYGLAPAATKVYRVQQGVSIGGYGEMLYENFSDERDNGTPSGATDRFDALRAILYVGYKFNDRLLFNSEIEVEHGNEIYLEFAYIDYLIADNIGLRGGLLLSPMGWVNELHEPPIFLGSTRPRTEQVIIPTTWRENGVGVFGDVGPVSYRAYVMNSLDAAGFSAGGLRGGRQKGIKAKAEDFSFIGRVDYTGLLGLTVGGALHLGETDQSHDGTLEVGTTIWDLHGEYKAYGFDLRALYAQATIDDAAALNQVRGFTGSASVGEKLTGWYLQGGYDLLRFADTTHELIPYLRYEQVDTQAEVPQGFNRNPASDQTIVTLGGAWKPIPNVVVKLDWQLQENEANTALDQFNIALGYLF